MPSSHSLPVIRCLETDLNWAEIRLYQCETGLGKLKSLSPVFDRLWNDGSAPLGHENKALSNLEKSSFRIVCGFNIDPKQADLLESCFLPMTVRREHTCNQLSQHQSGMKHCPSFPSRLCRKRHASWYVVRNHQASQLSRKFSQTDYSPQRRRGQ